MADHWIKVEKGTPDKPEVLQIASILNISDPDTVTGKLIRVWSWFDSNSENGHAPSVTNVLLDRLTGVTGFCDAMKEVGWLKDSEDGFLITNFDRHLGQSAKKRASDAERKRKSREMSQEKRDIKKTDNGLDKIRRDKKENIPYQQVADLYNSCIGDGFPKVEKVTTKRKPLIQKFYRNMDSDLDKVKAYFEYFGSNSPAFYRGDNNRGWKANFDYIIKEDTVQKCREDVL